MAEHTITFSLDPVQRADTVAKAKAYGVPVSEYIRFCLAQQARRELKKRDIRFLNNPLGARDDSQFIIPGQLELEVRG
jgi:hypothetical protein